MKDVLRLNSLVVLFVMLVFALAFACTSEEEPAQPATAPQPAAPAAVQATAVPAPTQPTVAKMEVEPEGTLTVALERIGLPPVRPWSDYLAQR